MGSTGTFKAGVASCELVAIPLPPTQELEARYGAWQSANAYAYNNYLQPTVTASDGTEWIIVGAYDGWFVLVEDPQTPDNDTYQPRRWIFAGNETLIRRFDLDDQLPCLQLKESRARDDDGLLAQRPHSAAIMYRIAVMRLSGLVLDLYETAARLAAEAKAEAEAV